MTPQANLHSDLELHQKLCQALLTLSEQESQALRNNQQARLQEISGKRRALAPVLDESVERLWQHRLAHQQASTLPRPAKSPEFQSLIRQTQDLIMRAIVLDRENELGLLRRGWVPTRELAQVAAPRARQATAAYRQSQGN